MIAAQDLSPTPSRSTEAVLQGRWSIDFSTAHITWSREIYEILQVSPDEILTLRRALSFFSPQDRDALGRAVRQSMALGPPFHMVVDCMTAQGVPLRVRLDEVLGAGRRVVEGTFRPIFDL